MTQSSAKPFSVGYVLRTTQKHVLKSIDLSIQKTFDRIGEFMEDPVKSKEVFLTLTLLHAMRKQCNDFQSQNSEHFKEKSHE